MIRFRCLACQAVLECGKHKARTKVACPRCGQRLLVPAAASGAQAQRQETVLGRLIELAEPRSDKASGQASARTEQPSGSDREHAAPIDASKVPAVRPMDGEWYYSMGGKESAGPISWARIAAL